MSFYADYLRENTRDHIIETKQGFASFRYVDQAVYILDIYIVPSFRKKKEASHLADEICKIAKQKGCVKLIGSIVPSNKNSTISLKVLLGYGMKLVSSINDMIFFEKEI